MVRTVVTLFIFLFCFCFDLMDFIFRPQLTHLNVIQKCLLLAFFFVASEAFGSAAVNAQSSSQIQNANVSYSLL
jgi:hypothetical protein